MILDVSAIAVVMLVAGFVCRWCLSASEEEVVQEGEEVVFTRPDEAIVVKIIGEDEGCLSSENLVFAQEVGADGR